MLVFIQQPGRHFPSPHTNASKRPRTLCKQEYHLSIYKMSGSRTIRRGGGGDQAEQMKQEMQRKEAKKMKVGEAPKTVTKIYDY